MKMKSFLVEGGFLDLETMCNAKLNYTKQLRHKAIRLKIGLDIRTLFLSIAKNPLRLFARGRWSVAIIIQWDTIAHKQCGGHT